MTLLEANRRRRASSFLLFDEEEAGLASFALPVPSVPGIELALTSRRLDYRVTEATGTCEQVPYMAPGDEDWLRFDLTPYLDLGELAASATTEEIGTNDLTRSHESVLSSAERILHRSVAIGKGVKVFVSGQQLDADEEAQTYRVRLTVITDAGRTKVFDALFICDYITLAGHPSYPVISEDDEEFMAIAYSQWLNPSELLDSVTFAEVDNGLSLTRQGVSTEELHIKHNDVPAGEAAQCAVSGATSGETYTVRVTVSSDAVVARTCVRDVVVNAI